MCDSQSVMSKTIKLVTLDTTCRLCISLGTKIHDTHIQGRVENLSGLMGLRSFHPNLISLH